MEPSRRPTIFEGVNQLDKCQICNEKNPFDDKTGARVSVYKSDALFWWYCDKHKVDVKLDTLEEILQKVREAEDMKRPVDSVIFTRNVFKKEDGTPDIFMYMPDGEGVTVLGVNNTKDTDIMLTVSLQLDGQETKKDYFVFARQMISFGAWSFPMMSAGGRFSVEYKEITRQEALDFIETSAKEANIEWVLKQ